MKCLVITHTVTVIQQWGSGYNRADGVFSEDGDRVPN